MSNDKNKGLPDIQTPAPEPNGLGPNLEDYRALAKTYAIDAGHQIACDFPTLDRRDRIQLVAAFRAQLIPLRPRGRKRCKEITAAHADWESGLRGLPLYRKHISGFDRMSFWKRQSKMRALKDAIRSRNRRTK